MAVPLPNEASFTPDLDREGQPRSKLRSWLHIFVSLAILYWLLRQVDVAELTMGIRQANWSLLLAGMIVFWIGIWVRAWRWQLIANKEAWTSSFHDALVVTFIGCALNVLLPASMGDVAKSYYGYRRLGNKEVMLSSSLVDKVLGMLAAFVLGIPLAAWMGLWGYFAIGLVLSAALCAILFFPGYLPWKILTWLALRVRKKIDPALLRNAATIDRKLLWVAFALSIVGWLMVYIQFYFAFLAFGGKVTLAHIFAVTPVIMLTKLLPFTLDGLGAQETASVKIFAHFGISDTVTLLATLASRVIGSWLPALVGVVMIIVSRRRFVSDVRIEPFESASDRPFGATQSEPAQPV